MLTLDQVKLLEAKVESLIGMVKSLYAERDALRETIKNKELLVEDLSQRVADYEAEQAKIEERVISALNQLDIFQSSVSNARTILSEKGEDDVLTSKSSVTSEMQESEDVESGSASDGNVSGINGSIAEVSKDVSSERSEGEGQAFGEKDLQQTNAQQEQETQPLSDKAEDDNSDKQMDIF